MSKSICLCLCLKSIKQDGISRSESVDNMWKRMKPANTDGCAFSTRKPPDPRGTLFLNIHIFVLSVSHSITFDVLDFCCFFCLVFSDPFSAGQVGKRSHPVRCRPPPDPRISGELKQPFTERFCSSAYSQYSMPPSGKLTGQ